MLLLKEDRFDCMRLAIAEGGFDITIITSQ